MPVLLASGTLCFGMSNIISRPNNERKPLKILNRLAVSHMVTPSQIIPTESGFGNIVRNTLLQMEDIVMPCRKGPF